MARPMQRSKQKSGSYRPTRTTSHRTYRKTTLKNIPDELARQWDKSKTLRENYARLGLASNLKMHAVGGVEKELPSKLAKEGEGESQGVAQGSGGAQMGQIIRDDAGNVIEVRLPESDSGEGSNKGKAKDESTPWGKPLDAGVVETPTVPLTFDDELKRGKHASDTDAVKILEAKAATAQPVGRNTSNDEMKWLVDIVRKYGRDLEEASRDLKINKWQKTKGELSRAVKRAGGFEVLEGLAAEN